MVNVAILFVQNLFSHQGEVRGGDVALLLLNSLFLGLVVFANLGFETIGLDLYIVALLAIIAAFLLWRRGKQPMFIYYTAAYWLGLFGSSIAQAMR